MSPFDKRRREKKQTVIEKLKAVTPEQVKAVAGKYFNEDHLTVAVLTPVALQGQQTKR